MRVRIWGSRGSIPTPGPATVEFGGNTPCVEVLGDHSYLILDAGTGIRELGAAIMREKRPGAIHILLSHTHWDHIQGFPFFTPAFVPTNTVHLYGPRNNVTDEDLRKIVDGQMRYSYFPVNLMQLQAKLHFHDLEPQRPFAVGEFTVNAQVLNHPVQVFGYRISDGSRTLVYMTDVEPYFDANQPDMPADEVRDVIEAMNGRLRDFAQGADLLIHDAQYTEKEYAQRRGWGHATYDWAVETARVAGVRRLVFFHHDPVRGDEELRALEREHCARAQAAGCVCEAAREGALIEL